MPTPASFPRVFSALALWFALSAATSPAQSAPKDAVESFLRAMLAGDVKTAASLLYFSNPDHQAAAQVLLDQIAAGQRLRNAVDKRFPAPNLTIIVAQHERQDLTDMLKSLAEPEHARITSTTAELTLGKGSKFHLVNRDGQWKIDFEKTQDEEGGMPSKSELEAAKIEAKALDQLAADVAAGKFDKVEQVETLYQQIASPASTQPATAPASAPH